MKSLLASLVAMLVLTALSPIGILCAALPFSDVSFGDLCFMWKVVIEEVVVSWNNLTR